MSVPDAIAALADESPDAVVVVAADGRIAYANGAALALFGYASSDLLGRPAECLVPDALQAAHAPRRAAYVAAPVARPMGAGLALSARHRDGTVFPVEISLRPAGHADERCVVATVRDWRPIERLERVLSPADEQLRAIVDHASAFFALLTPAGTLVRANRSALRTIDAAPEMLLGRPFPETPWFVNLPGAQLRVQQAIVKAATGVQTRVQVDQYLRGGHRAAVDLTITPIHDGAGHVTMLLVESRDISDRQAVERALSETHRRLALATRGTHDGIWDWQLDTGECYYSPRWKELLGYGERDIADHEASFFSRVHPDDLEAVRAALARHFDTGDRFDIETRLRHRTGEFRWFRYRGQAEWGDNGRPLRMAGSMTDITREKKHEAEIIAVSAMLAERVSERTAALEHRSEQLSQLATDLTLAEQHAREQLAKTLHDGLQQLLFSAKLRLDRAVQRAGAASPGLAGLLAEVHRDLDDAVASARSLAVELFPPALQQRDLLEALAWLAAWVGEKYGLDVSVSGDREATPERRDVRILLFESVRELLFNAVKHARTGKASVHLGRGADDTLVITVEDAGAGFDPSSLALAQRSTRSRGLGLLSIRERLVLLGGRLEIDAAPGRGARFQLVAPRHGVAARVPREHPTADVPPIADLPVPRMAPSAARAIRVLIADDHPVVRTGLREMLQDRAQFIVVGEASDGAEAVAQARALRPDAIVMDVSMPRLDGIEATRLIHREFPSIQILGLSTQTATAHPHPIEDAGAAGYYTKGADTQRLIDRLLAVHPMGDPETDAPR